MSNQFKSSLLAASAIIAAAATPAHAQLVYPAIDLHGAGATSIQDIMPREANCIGNLNAVPAVPGPRLNNSSFLPSGATVFNYRSALEVAGGTAKFNCATESIQPNLTMRYVSVGSSGGRNGFVAATPANVGTAIFGSNTRPDPAIFGSDTTTWSMPHFAMSDAPLTQANINTWTTNRAPTAAAANAGKGAGAMIQIPLYVLPVGIAYAPVYGLKEGTTPGTFDVPMTFNIVGATALGGLRLSKPAYCGIFNGNITNWNHPEIARPNTTGTGAARVTVQLFDTVNDNATRWRTEGAPIRLIGRLDGSGTTDIFARHLAATCTGPIIAGIGTNKFAQAAEQLPYNPTSGVNMAGLVSGITIRYVTTAGGAGFVTSNFAGPTNMINGAFFDGSGFGGTAEGITPNAAGTNGTGLYLLANGGGNVASAITNTVGGGALIPSADGSIRFNGKIGYISNDTILANAGLRAAALEVGNTYDKGLGKKPLFQMPTAASATAAFGKIVPPESTSKGVYLPIANPIAGDLVRTNPLAWYEALYANLSTLANPTVGYPITGTTQIITGTCFADPAARNGMVTMLRTMLGLNFVKSDAKKFDKNLFLGAKAPNFSLRATNGLAQLPTAWIAAIRDTFLARASVKQPGLAALNLYIQNGMPTEKFNAYLGTSAPKIAKGSVMTAAQLAGIPASYATAAAPTVNIFPLGAPNPTCTPGQGITN